MKCAPLLLLLSALAIPAALRAGDDTSNLRPIAWAATEVASGQISTGRVKVTHPILNCEAQLGAEYLPLGYATIGVWSLSDLSSSYRHKRSWFWNEIDPVVTVGRHQPLADGYVLSARLGAQWNEMAGYRGDARRSYDEWQMGLSLTTPWVTPWYSMRNYYWPVVKASFRVGLTRTFALTDRLSVTPNVWLDGGSGRWNRQRFGYQNATRIGAGANSVSLRIFAHYQFLAHAWLYGGVTGYCVIDPDVRAELRDNPTDEAKYVYAVATCGVKVSF